MPEEIIHQKHRLSSFQIIISGFVGVILLGALLLMLPVSTTEGCITPFNETLFTATSAVCVTGLVVQDTGSYWSGFGQAVILALIQIGGLGVVTVAASFALLSGRKISLMRSLGQATAILPPRRCTSLYRPISTPMPELSIKDTCAKLKRMPRLLVFSKA